MVWIHNIALKDAGNYIMVKKPEPMAFQRLVHIITNVCYHDDGSKELNACIRFLLHMVYL
jgi:hypothetical protein